jgi:hypothetical protein|nr:MAG TPA_asm: hypothetical protein [Caudoviricetes sp.]
MGYNNMGNVPYYGQPQYQMQSGNIQQPMNAVSQPGYSVRPVGSREEAVGAQVDFMGPGTLMPDFGHGVIYFKRFNPNKGSTELFDFRVTPPEEQPKYATLADLDALRAELTAKKPARRKDDAE